MLDNLKIIPLDPFNIGQEILVCITATMTETELSRDWRSIRNYVATEYQTADIDDFKRWNFYIFYLVDNMNKIDRSLKYEIEHDTISSRKIIVDWSEFDSDENKLVDKYIRFKPQGNSQCADMKVFNKQSEVEELLKCLSDED